MFSESFKRTVIPWVVVLLFLSPATPLGAQTSLKPGMNFFSVQQDVQLGREASKEAEKELELIRDPEAEAYLNNLGKRIARHSKLPELPYQFRFVNSKDINAFALPGGFVYVNRGLVEAADNESELAGVLGHEISHAALRHGTNQLSKQMLISAPLSIIGGIMGQSGGWKEQLAAMGISLFGSGLMLKYSRNAENQADLAGVQAVHAAGIDPEGAMTFFRKLERLRDSEPSRLETFFSSHPAPGDRVKSVGAEIVKLPLLKNPVRDTAEFQGIKARFKSLPAPRQRQLAGHREAAPGGQIPDPSPRFAGFQQRQGLYRFDFPDNWRVAGEGGAGVTIVPPGGLGVQNQISHGMMANVFEVNRSRATTLERATDEFLDHLEHGNPHLREVRGTQSRLNLGGARALSVLLSGVPPRSREAENVWVVTRAHPEGLFYFVFVSPEREFGRYRPTFEQILRSARFPRD